MFAVRAGACPPVPKRAERFFVADPTFTVAKASVDNSARYSVPAEFPPSPQPTVTLATSTVVNGTAGAVGGRRKVIVEGKVVALVGMPLCAIPRTRV